MGHGLLKKAILLLKMANVRFDLLIAVYIYIGVIEKPGGHDKVGG